jgi:hypothetical protein
LDLDLVDRDPDLVVTRSQVVRDEDVEPANRTAAATAAASGDEEGDPGQQGEHRRSNKKGGCCHLCFLVGRTNAPA